MQYFYAHVTTLHKQAFSPSKQLTAVGKAAEGHVSQAFKLDPRTQDGRTGIPRVLDFPVPGLPMHEGLLKCPSCQFVAAKTTSLRNHFYYSIKAENKAIRQHRSTKAADRPPTSGKPPRNVHQLWSTAQHKVKGAVGQRLIKNNGQYTQVKTPKHVEAADLEEIEEQRKSEADKEIDSLFSYKIPGGGNTSLSTKWTADLGWQPWLEDWKHRSSQLGLSLDDLRSLVSLSKVFQDEGENGEESLEEESERDAGHAEQAIQDGLVAFHHWLHEYMSDANSFLATCSPGVRATLTANQ
jgi:hypothetical protein